MLRKASGFFGCAQRNQVRPWCCDVVTNDLCPALEPSGTVGTVEVVQKPDTDVFSIEKIH